MAWAFQQLITDLMEVSVHICVLLFALSKYCFITVCQEELNWVKPLDNGCREAAVKNMMSLQQKNVMNKILQDIHKRVKTVLSFFCFSLPEQEDGRGACGSVVLPLWLAPLLSLYINTIMVWNSFTDRKLRIQEQVQKTPAAQRSRAINVPRREMMMLVCNWKWEVRPENNYMYVPKFGDIRQWMESTYPLEHFQSGNRTKLVIMFPIIHTQTADVPCKALACPLETVWDLSPRTRRPTQDAWMIMWM